MLLSTSTVMTVYAFSFCNLAHPLISPALKNFIFFTGNLSLCNKFITEYHFSDKINPDSQEILCTMVLQRTHLSCVWIYFFLLLYLITSSCLIYFLLLCLLTFLQIHFSNTANYFPPLCNEHC